MVPFGAATISNVLEKRTDTRRKRCVYDNGEHSSGPCGDPCIADDGQFRGKNAGVGAAALFIPGGV